MRITEYIDLINRKNLTDIEYTHLEIHNEHKKLKKNYKELRKKYKNAE